VRWVRVSGVRVCAGSGQESVYIAARGEPGCRRGRVRDAREPSPLTSFTLERGAGGEVTLSPRPIRDLTTIVSTPRLPIQRRFGWALDGDGWAFGWGWMGVSADPKKVWTGYRWGFGWAFPADVVVPRSALEFPDKTGPPERERAILGRLGRFIFRNLVLKPCDHTIGSRTCGLGARAAVSALANSSASSVSTTPNSTLAITFQATVVDDGRLRAGRWTSRRLHGRGRPRSKRRLHSAADRSGGCAVGTGDCLKHYAFDGFFALSK